MVKFPLKALSGDFAASSPRGRAKLEAQQPDKLPFDGAFIKCSRNVIIKIFKSGKVSGKISVLALEGCEC